MTALRYSANLSTLYADRPVLDRAAAAAADGFTLVESWWPFDEPAPAARALEDFSKSLEEAGVQLTCVNLDAGDPGAGQRGLLSDPMSGRRVEQNLTAVLDLLAATGCQLVNALYGNRLPGVDETEQDRVALERLVRVADAVGSLGASVVLETLNSVDSPTFPLTDPAATADLMRRVNERARRRNVGLLVDVYHLATMGVDPATTLSDLGEAVLHVQFADAPGRGRPGTGSLDFAAVERVLRAIGYRGVVGLEYLPQGVINGQGVSI